jgi:hypothetical protein
MAIDGGLRSLFIKHLTPFGFDCQAIETGGTGLGVPDMNYCYQGLEGWCEFKKTSAWAIQISAEQVGWLSRRQRAKGVCYVVIRRKCSAGPRRKAADELWIYEGQDAAQLKEFGLKAPIPVLLKLMGGPSKWDWNQVKLVLTGAR